jgi:hypothetical protein
MSKSSDFQPNKSCIPQNIFSKSMLFFIQRMSCQNYVYFSIIVIIKVNTEKTQYMLLSHHQNAGQNHDIKTGNRCFENVEQFRYLGTTITNRNLIHEEIKRRLRGEYIKL